MPALHKLLVLCAAPLIICSSLIYAQDKKQPQRKVQLDGKPHHVPCQSCDSLAEAYLFARDTSMAIYYYQLFVDTHPEDQPAKRSLNKLQKNYANQKNSFYLTEH